VEKQPNVVFLMVCLIVTYTGTVEVSRLTFVLVSYFKAQ